MSPKTELGTIQLRNEVISTIASLAAQEVQGVVGVWRGLPFGSRLGLSGVRVGIQDQEVRLDLSLIIEYGTDIPSVAAQVQERVRERVEGMTHLSVSEVNVSIHHVKPSLKSLSKPESLSKPV